MAPLGRRFTDDDAGRSRVAGEYRYIADRYDRRWRNYIARTNESTLARLPLTGDERLLDVGCGTGQLLAALAARYPKLSTSGVDPVGAMLNHAGQRVPAATDLHRAQAEQLPFADGAYDVVVTTNVLHYLLRPAAGIAECRRVLRPGGIFLLTDWCGDYRYYRALDAYLWLTGRGVARTRTAATASRLLTDAGFELELVDRYKIDWRWGLMTLRARAV